MLSSAVLASNTIREAIGNPILSPDAAPEGHYSPVGCVPGWPALSECLTYQKYLIYNLCKEPAPPTLW